MNRSVLETVDIVAGVATLAALGSAVAGVITMSLPALVAAAILGGIAVVLRGIAYTAEERRV